MTVRVAPAPSTVFGEQIRTWCGIGLVGFTVDAKRAPTMVLPDDARAFADELVRMANESDRIEAATHELAEPLREPGKGKGRVR